MEKLVMLLWIAAVAGITLVIIVVPTNIMQEVTEFLQKGG